MSNDDHLLVPVVDIVLAYRNNQGNVTCVFNVAAGVGLQFLAQSDSGKYFAIANHYIYNIRALTIKFLVLEILWLNIASQDSDSDDDISVISGSDSDILEMVEKADFVEFSDNDSSTFAESEGDLDK